MKLNKHVIKLASTAYLLTLSFTANLEAADSADSKTAPQKQQQTTLGIFNPLSAESAKELGAKAVRIFIPKETLKQGPTQQAIDKLAQYKRAGLTVIITIASGSPKIKAALPEKDSAKWNETLDRFEAFVRAAGPYIDYCALGNEPTLELPSSDFVPNNGASPPVVEYFRALAARAHKIVSSDPKLTHLKISSPALFSLHDIGKKKYADGHLANPILEWEISDSNVDVIDLHTHVKSVSEIDEELNFIENKTRKPIIITEWSQAAAAKDWLRENIETSFSQKWKLDSKMNNKDFIEASYVKPVSKAEWEEFVSKAPYDPSFMKDAFATIIKHGVAVATYGAGRQYGSSKFDSKQLLANLTVVPKADRSPEENYLFSRWYRELAKSTGTNPKQ